jgi:hypothetical protein
MMFIQKIKLKTIFYVNSLKNKILILLVSIKLILFTSSFYTNNVLKKILIRSKIEVLQEHIPHNLLLCCHSGIQ